MQVHPVGLTHTGKSDSSLIKYSIKVSFHIFIYRLSYSVLLSFSTLPYENCIYFVDQFLNLPMEDAAP